MNRKRKIKIPLQSALFALLILFSCTKGQESASTKYAVGSKILKFSIDNLNREAFGYLQYEDGLHGPADGITSMFVYDERFVLFTDNLHKNVKRVDLKTGSIRASVDSLQKPIDIVLYADKVFVLSGYSHCFALNKSLDLIGDEPLPVGYKYFFVADTTLGILNQFEHAKQFNAYLLDKQTGLFTRRSRVNESEKPRLDMWFTQKEVGSKVIVTNAFGKYAIDKMIPSLVEVHDAYNVFFTRNCIFFYSYDEEYKNLLVTWYNFASTIK